MDLLSRCDEKHGGYDRRNLVLAMAAEKVIEFEERGIHDPSACSDIPEMYRIRINSLEPDAVNEVLLPQYRRTPYD